MKIRLSLLDLENIYFWLLHLGPIFTLLYLYYSRASLVCMVARCVHFVSFVPRLHDDIKGVRNVVE